MTHPVDQNGNRLYRRLQKETDGTWSVNVWAGSWPPMTTLARYHYSTRAQARNADITDIMNNGPALRKAEYK